MSRVWNRLVALLVSAIGLVPGQADAAEACKLLLAASLPLVRAAPDQPVAPAEIDGQPSRLVVDTGVSRSQIFAHAADALKLPRIGLSDALPADLYAGSGTAGPMIRQETTVRDFRLGGLDLPGVSFLVLPDGPAEGGAAGRVGMDLLRNYDVELNLAQHKINLFSQDHCMGGVVYWSRSYLSAPILVGADGRLMVQVTLDGRRFQATIVSGAGHSSIRQSEASRLFGVTPQSPDVEVIGTTVGAGGALLTTYRAPFRALELAGVTFHDPPIRVLPDLPRDVRRGEARPGDAMMTLGAEELSKLRIYLALKERMIYLTPAEPDQPT